MGWSLPPQMSPACLLCLIWMVCEMGGRWPYSCIFFGCCFQEMLLIARSTLTLLPSNFFSNRFVRVHTIVPTQPLLSSNTVLLHQKNEIFIRLITCQYQHTSSLNVLYPSEVFPLGCQLLVLLSMCFSFRYLHLLSAMLIMIVYLQTYFWFIFMHKIYLYCSFWNV